MEKSGFPGTRNPDFSMINSGSAGLRRGLWITLRKISWISR